MNILLHICCAPCALYTVDKLKQDGHKVEGFFYNPNIYPLAEYKLRRQAVSQMANRINIRVMFEQPLGVSVRNDEQPCSQPTLAVTKLQRCIDCWQMRLGETSKMANLTGFDAFSTTLLISPYQDHSQIKNIGEALAEEAKTSFYYEDFRTGFRKSQSLAKEGGYYRQKYCGCRLSREQ